MSFNLFNGKSKKDDMETRFLKGYFQESEDPIASYKTFVNLGIVLLHHDHVTKDKLMTILSPKSFMFTTDLGNVTISLTDEKWIYASVSKDEKECCRFLTNEELDTINNVLSKKASRAEEVIFDVIHTILTVILRDIMDEMDNVSIFERTRQICQSL